MSDLLGPLLPYIGLPAQPEGNLRLAITLLAWLVVALLVSAAMSVGRRVSLRTGTDYDDVLLHRIRAPLGVAFLFAVIADALSPWGVAALGRAIRTATTIGLIYAIVWLVQRLVIDVVLHLAQRRAASSATSIDDILVPIVRSVIRPITFGIGTMFALEAAGLPIAGAALLVGGASFVLAFALQSTLEDVFGGVGLVVDTPFAVGDVLRLEDGTLCQVAGLGMRVTRLYNAHDHSIITHSNRGLVQQAIVNLSRPTPDMGLTIRVQVARDSDTRLVWERLTEAGLAHPWTLGDTAKKLPAMRRSMDRLVRVRDYRRAFHTIKDLQRVAAEGDLVQAVERLAGHIVEAASRSNVLERGGFTRDERSLVDADLDRLRLHVREVKRSLAVWLLMVRYTYVEGRFCTLTPDAEQRLEDAVRAAQVAGRNDGNQTLERIHALIDDHFATGFTRVAAYAAAAKGWVEAALEGVAAAPPICLPGNTPHDEAYFLTQRQEAHIYEAGFAAGLTDRAHGGIPDIDQVEEYLALFAEWNKKMQILDSRVRDLVTDTRRSGGVRLDERLHDLRRWLGSDFKENTPEWKYPRTPLVGIGDRLTYELKVYVDNVKLSHFTRVAQAESQIRLDVLHLLRDQSPAVTFEGD